MKFTSLLIAACTVATIGCTSGNKTTIKCKVTDPEASNITYCYTTDGFLQPDQITPEIGPDSTFTIEMTGQGVQKITFMNPGKSSANIFIRPGYYEVTLDPAESDFITYGQGFTPGDIAAFKAEHNAIATYWDYMMSQQALDLKGDTIASSVRHKITAFTDSIKEVMSGADESINGALLQSADLTAALIFDAAFSYATSPRLNLSEAERTRWNNAHNEFFGNIDLNNRYNTLSEHITQLSTSMKYSYLFDTYGRDSLRTLNDDMLNDITYDWIGNNFKDNVAEYLKAYVLISDSESGKLSQGLEELYDKFKTEYPSSPMAGAVEAAMTENRRANSTEEITGINFINADSVSSIAALIAGYNGRPVLVDVWATWCGPCRRSFAHAPEIQKYAADNNIALLYITIDEGDDAIAHSRKLARYYDLKGDHLAITPAMKEEVFTTYGSGGYLSIPAVALYDSDGTRVDHPIDGESLPSVLEALQSIRKQ